VLNAVGVGGGGILCATSAGTWIHLPVGFFHEPFPDHGDRGRDSATGGGNLGSTVKACST